MGKRRRDKDSEKIARVLAKLETSGLDDRTLSTLLREAAALPQNREPARKRLVRSLEARLRERSPIDTHVDWAALRLLASRLRGVEFTGGESYLVEGTLARKQAFVQAASRSLAGLTRAEIPESFVETARKQVERSANGRREPVEDALLISLIELVAAMGDEGLTALLAQPAIAERDSFFRSQLKAHLADVLRWVRSGVLSETEKRTRCEALSMAAAKLASG
jgi:hypothetical protein